MGGGWLCGEEQVLGRPLPSHPSPLGHESQSCLKLCQPRLPGVLSHPEVTAQASENTPVQDALCLDAGHPWVMFRRCPRPGSPVLAVSRLHSLLHQQDLKWES